MRKLRGKMMGLESWDHGVNDENSLTCPNRLLNRLVRGHTLILSMERDPQTGTVD